MSEFYLAPPRYDFSPEAFADFKAGVEAFDPTDQFSDYTLGQLHGMGVGGLLEGAFDQPDYEMPAVDLLEYMTRQPRCGTDGWGYRVAQMISACSRPLQQMAMSGDPEVGGRALSLLYESYTRFLEAGIGGLDNEFYANNLSRVVSRDSLNDRSNNYRRYGVVARGLVDAERHAYAGRVIDACRDLSTDPDTSECAELMLDQIRRGQGLATANPDELDFVFRVQGLLSTRQAFDENTLQQVYALSQEGERYATDYVRRYLTEALENNWTRAAASGHLYDELLAVALDKFGLSGSQMVDAWHKALRDASSYGFRDYAARNLAAVHWLEESAQGSAAALHSQFRISNFARNSIRLWLQQYNERHRQDLQYGIIDYDLYDYIAPGGATGALSQTSLRTAVDHLATEANKRGVGVRIYERGNLVESIRQARGHSNQRLAFGLVAAHGSKHTAGSLATHSILWQPAEPDVFADEANIALFSCRTGEQGGIAEALNAHYGRPVQAPTDAACMKGLTVGGGQNGLQISIDFSPDVGRLIHS